MTTATQIRQSKKAQIQEFFAANIGKKFSSSDMHFRWGSSFRTRASEISRDTDSGIVIRNEVKMIGDDKECSWYWAERRVRNAAVQLEMGLLGGKHENGNVA